MDPNNREIDITREGHCDHKRSTTGCDVCCMLDHQEELRVSMNEHTKYTKEEDTAFQRLNDQTLQDEQRKEIQNAKDLATQQAEAWAPRIDQLMDIVERCKETVLKVTEGEPQEQWAKKFQELADEKVRELDTIYKLAYKDAGVKLREQDDSLRVEFAGLDRSRIPATADCLVSMGKGLELYFLHCRRNKNGPNGGPRPPTMAVGEELAPAFMSPGRAISMFGPVEDLGDNPTPPELESDKTRALSDKLQRNSITPSLADEETIVQVPAAKTEREHREQDSQHPPSSSKLTEDEQFSKFSIGAYISYTALLAEKYVELVSMKESKPEATADEDPEESPAFPAVGELDFAGFTNWIQDCEYAYPEFRDDVLAGWEDAIKGRDENIGLRVDKALEQWEVDDASLGIGPPSQWNSQLPLAPKDLERLGIWQAPKGKGKVAGKTNL